MNTFSCGMKIWVLKTLMVKSKFYLIPYLYTYYIVLYLYYHDIFRYMKLVKKYELEISQPAVTTKKPTPWKMTLRRSKVEVHKYGYIILYYGLINYLF